MKGIGKPPGSSEMSVFFTEFVPEYAPVRDLGAEVDDAREIAEKIDVSNCPGRAAVLCP